MTRVKELEKTESPDKTHAVLIGTDENEDDVWSPLHAISGRLTQSLEAVGGGGLGGVSEGDTFAEGERLETVVRNLLRERETYDYRSPSLALSGTGEKVVEAGSEIAPVLTADWTKNDAGDLTGLTIDGQNVQPSPYELPVSTFTIGDNNESYRAEASYEEGPVVDDSLGDPSPGNIQAGTIQSGYVTYRGRRRLFLGTFGFTFSLPGGSDPDYIRNELTDSIPESMYGEAFGLLDPKENVQYTFNIPGGTQSIVFAYPDDLKEADEVLYVEASNRNEIGSFSLETFEVAGANGFSPIPYKVYIWNGAKGFSNQVTYKLRI